LLANDFFLKSFWCCIIDWHPKKDLFNINW
jgi:hypothetical protein